MQAIYIMRFSTLLILASGLLSTTFALPFPPRAPTPPTLDLEQVSKSKGETERFRQFYSDVPVFETPHGPIRAPYDEHSLFLSQLEGMGQVNSRHSVFEQGRMSQHYGTAQPPMGQVNSHHSAFESQHSAQPPPHPLVCNVPYAGGSDHTKPKKKRGKIVLLTPQQFATLDKYYRKVSPLPGKVDKEKLAKEVGISVPKLTKWFEHKRAERGDTNKIRTTTRGGQQ